MDAIPYLHSPFSYCGPDGFHDLLAELPFAFGSPRDFDILSDVTGELRFSGAALEDAPRANSLEASDTGAATEDQTLSDPPTTDTLIPDVSSLILDAGTQPATADGATFNQGDTD
jgi:hypothetical protein